MAEVEVEVVTGEVVEPEGIGVRWKSWEDAERMQMHFDITVDDRWMHVATDTDRQMLHAAFETIRMLAGGSPTS